MQKSCLSLVILLPASINKCDWKFDLFYNIFGDRERYFALVIYGFMLKKYKKALDNDLSRKFSRFKALMRNSTKAASFFNILISARSFAICCGFFSDAFSSITRRYEKHLRSKKKTQATIHHWILLLFLFTAPLIFVIDFWTSINHQLRANIFFFNSNLH